VECGDGELSWGGLTYVGLGVALGVGIELRDFRRIGTFVVCDQVIVVLSALTATAPVGISNREKESEEGYVSV
jgi:hypothetical protein